MDRDRLKGYLDQGMSLPQIGALENRDPSTVGYWVKKHGLVANGRDMYAPRGGLTREQLEPLAEEGLTLKEIARRLDRSERTIRYWLARHGLKTRARRGPRPSVPPEVVARALAAGKRTVMGRCRRHGATEFAIAGVERKPRCKACRSEAVTRRRRRVKEILVAEAGGRCRLCGYDRYLGALHFHHRDPGEKAFAVAHRGVTRAIADVRAEVAKCVLLCSNCHAEVEAGFSRL